MHDRSTVVAHHHRGKEYTECSRPDSDAVYGNRVNQMFIRKRPAILCRRITTVLIARRRWHLNPEPTAKVPLTEANGLVVGILFSQLRPYGGVDRFSVAMTFQAWGRHGDRQRRTYAAVAGDNDARFRGAVV